MSPIDLARRFHAQSVWKDVPFDEGRVAALIENAQSGKHGMDYVPAPDGFLVMVTAPLHMNGAVPVSMELAWGAARDGRQTIERAKQRAAERGAAYFMAAAETAPMERLYRRWGGERISSSYRWQINGY